MKWIRALNWPNGCGEISNSNKISLSRNSKICYMILVGWIIFDTVGAAISATREFFREELLPFNFVSEILHPSFTLFKQWREQPDEPLSPASVQTRISTKVLQRRARLFELANNNSAKARSLSASDSRLRTWTSS